MTITEGTDSAWTDEFRKEVFLALVEAQDQNISVKDSRADVAKRFGLTSTQVQIIEREGIDGQWPPLT
jgi:hypothetical protein